MMDEELKKKLQEAANDALMVQNAVNLGPILMTWAKHQPTLVQVCNGNGNDAYKHHPINLAFMSKVASLMCVDVETSGSISSLHGGDTMFQEVEKLATDDHPAYDWLLRYGSRA